MEINVILKNNKGYTWLNNGNVFVKGYAFDEENNYLEKSDFIDFFVEVNSKDKFIEKLKTINGFFSVVIKHNHSLFAAVDHVRTSPLFYYTENNTLHITDSIDLDKPIELDKVKKQEFIATGYTIGDSTLINNIKQLVAGQFLVFLNNKKSIDYYYRHIRTDNKRKAKEKYFNELEIISQNIFNRLKIHAKNKTIVIPLSGGYDSRYIAGFCKKIGLTNVICYTYGRQGSFEVKISKKVADELGYKWCFVEYNKKKWESMLYSEHTKKYFEFASNQSSLPVFQDLIALGQLKKEGVIPVNSIFIPGFSGDMLGGSLLPQEFFFKKEKKILNMPLEKYIYNIFYKKTDKLIKHELLLNIKNSLPNTIIKTSTNFVSSYEEWFLRQKIGKYINNALRIYEFFDYQWLVPLWDKELIEYWYTVPIELRIQSELYNEFLFNNVFNPLNIGIKKPDEMKPNKFRNIVKRFVPSFILPFMTKVNLILRGKRELVNLNSSDQLISIISNHFMKDNIKIDKGIGLNSVFILYLLEYHFKK